VPHRHAVLRLAPGDQRIDRLAHAETRLCIGAFFLFAAADLGLMARERRSAKNTGSR